jgi:hypothetical protein
MLLSFNQTTSIKMAEYYCFTISLPELFFNVRSNKGIYSPDSLVIS